MCEQRVRNFTDSLAKSHRTRHMVSGTGKDRVVATEDRQWGVKEWLLVFAP